MSNAKPAERRKCVSPAPATRASSLSPWSRRPLPSRALFGTHRSPRPPRPRRSLFRAKAPPQAPLEPVNVNYRAQVRANADTRLPDVHPGIPPSSHPRVSDAHFKNRLPSDARARSPLVPRPRQAAPSAPAPRGAATPKAHREVVVEDGFKYKRRKSGTPGARAGPSSNRVSGGAIVLKSEKSDKRDVSQRLSSSLPPDYPGLGVHERVPEDLPEEERMQMLIEEICELECKVERERLIKDFGPNDGAAMASALERACSEFQLKVEELVVRGDVQFDVSTTALREMRDAARRADARRHRLVARERALRRDLSSRGYAKPLHLGQRDRRRGRRRGRREADLGVRPRCTCLLAQCLGNRAPLDDVELARAHRLQDGSKLRRGDALALLHGVHHEHGEAILVIVAAEARLDLRHNDFQHLQLGRGHPDRLRSDALTQATKSVGGA